MALAPAFSAASKPSLDGRVHATVMSFDSCLTIQASNRPARNIATKSRLPNGSLNRSACNLWQPLRGWALPVIETLGDLADWLCLSIGELEWFADLKGLGYKLRNQKLHHYHYRILTKRSGGVRLIESPESNLKALQRNDQSR